MIVRKQYLSELIRYMDKPFIKVVTGLRRVGKSVLLDLYIDQLKELGVRDDQILKINFELPSSFEISDYLALTDVVLKWSSNKEKPMYLFFDEIGRVREWERAINGFHAMNQFDIYITGSNADLLSADLGTYLAGRYVELLVHPFSYKEFMSLYPKATFQDYLVFGGIPSIEAFRLEYESSMNVLRDSFHSAVLQDVIKRNKIRNPIVLEKLLQYIFQNTSKTFSALSISKYLKSQRIQVTVDTILNYIRILQDAFLIYKASRNDLIGKSIMKTEEKYFIADHGFREAIVGNNLASIELILENIVYIELLRRGYTVSVGKVHQKEIDFVAIKGNITEYFQVSYLMTSEETRTREFSVFDEIPDHYKKYVLSMDQVDFSQNGIIHQNIESFLLE